MLNDYYGSQIAVYSVKIALI